jgi:predicted CXXCH cytochrome family protein
MRRVLLCVGLIALLTGVRQAGMAAGKDQQATSTKSTYAVDPASYVGSDTCMTCHEDVAKNFATNPHSRLALMHGGKGATCESCHGPGKAHVDGGGDAAKIFRFSNASGKEIDATCLGCHAAAHPNYERSAHAEAGVTCTSCHSIHSFEAPWSQGSAQQPARFIRRDNVHSSEGTANLLKLSQPTLCFTCHSDVKPAFAQPFHHQVEEGLVRCTDCHDPHGTFQQNQLRVTADQNAICTRCHTENAGPFVYEHPVIKTEGCTSCHSPHGSPNPRLLNVSNVNTLCLQCHSASMNFHAPGAPSFHNQATQYQACTLCHTQIHGSNASNVLFK